MSKEMKIEHFIKDGTGVISLNREVKLNVLDEEMIDLLSAILVEFKSNTLVDRILIRGRGEKAFCAGGDVVSVVQEIEKGREVDFFFKKEYFVDQLIHEFPKPVFTLGHGVIFGGGFGLFCGGSTRISTDNSIFSMPEVTIGFFPDVASSFFLQKVPRSWRVFMGMCGARINGHWAYLLGLTDFVISSKDREKVLALIKADLFKIDHLIVETPEESIQEFQMISETIGVIEDMRSCEDFNAWIKSTLVHSKSPYLKNSAKAYLGGSRLSSMMTWKLFHWCEGKSLADCFSKDLELARLFGEHSDFKEGVRALLVDKDKAPIFRYKTYKEVQDSELSTFLSLF